MYPQVNVTTKHYFNTYHDMAVFCEAVEAIGHTITKISRATEDNRYYVERQYPFILRINNIAKWVLPLDRISEEK